MSVAMPSDKAKEIIKNGSVSIRVKRAGMLQFQIFKVRKVELGGGQFTELYVNRMIEISELHRIANELDLPVEAENGRAFPEGKGAKDFMNL
jgi:hypothetical protein